MLRINELFTDATLERDGVWVDFEEGSRLRIASKENPAYKAYLSTLAGRHKLAIGKKVVKPSTIKLMNEVMTDAMAKHLLVDWEGIALNEEDGPVPYTYDTGKMVLLNARELFDFVDQAADDYSRFKAEQEDEVKKPSSGT